MKNIIFLGIFVLLTGVWLLITFTDRNIASVKVGVIAPLTGDRSDAGEFMVNSILIAQKEINSDKERYQNIELIVEDSQYEAAPAISSLRKLIEIDKVQYIIGPYGSTQVMAIAPIIEESKTIMITPGAQSSDITTAGDYIFRNIHNTAQEAPFFAKFIAGNMDGDVLHVLSSNNSFSISYLENLIPVLEEAGKEVFVKPIDLKNSDFKTELTQLRLLGAKNVFPIATPKHMGLILKQSDQVGLESNFFHIGVEGPELIATAGALAEGIFYPYSYDSKSSIPSISSFYKKYFEKYFLEPDTVAANTYDALYLLSNCFEKVGNDSEKVKDCLYSIEFFGGAGGTYGFDENGDSKKEIFVKTVRDGKLVRYEN